MNHQFNTTNAPELHASPETARAALARSYDRQADAELHFGHVITAERLAWQAAALRGAGQ